MSTSSMDGKAFCPAVKNYVEDRSLPPTALTDSASAHPQDLKKQLAEELQWLSVEFLPPNITPLLEVSYNL